MDLEREESVGDNGNLDSSVDLVSKNESNGSINIDLVRQLSDGDVVGMQVQDKGGVNLSHGLEGLNCFSSPSSPRLGDKGRGLRRWRRIKREFTRGGGAIFGTRRLAKRGFPIAGPQGKTMPSSSRENSEYQGSSTAEDALIQSIYLLQSTQGDIEREIQKIREMGKEDILVDDSNQESCLPSESETIGLEDNGSGDDKSPHSLHVPELEESNSRENKHLVEIKLEETTALLKIKEAKIDELQERLGSLTNKKQVNFPDLESELETLCKQRIEADIEYLTISKTIQALKVVLESELETLCKQRIEADIECLTISKTIQALKFVLVDQISQLKEKTATEQSQITNKLMDAESKTENLKSEVKRLERHCEDLLSAHETVKLQTSVFKYSCFLIQVVLLGVIVGVLIFQLSHHSAEEAPT